jgi:hypothetical protein
MKKLFFLVPLFFIVCTLSAQNLLKLSAEVYTSYNEMEGAYENFDKMRSVVKDIENGGKPNIASYGSDWSKLANNYKKAAQTIKAAPLVTDFDSKPYAVSLEELTNCYLKEQNFNKLRGFKKELDDAVVRGQNELKKIADYKILITKTYEALKYLIDINVKLSSVPIFNEIFQWNWFDLEMGVRPALGELSTAVNQQEKKLKSEIDKVSLHASNLGSNITLLEGSVCLIAGVYKGNIAEDGDNISIRLTINMNGTQYNGVFAYTEDGESDSKNIPVITIASGRYISFSITADGETSSFSGELSPDYKEIRNFKMSGETFSVTLRK